MADPSPAPTVAHPAAPPTSLPWNSTLRIRPVDLDRRAFRAPEVDVHTNAVGNKAWPQSPPIRPLEPNNPGGGKLLQGPGYAALFSIRKVGKVANGPRFAFGDGSKKGKVVFRQKLNHRLDGNRLASRGSIRSARVGSAMGRRAALSVRCDPAMRPPTRGALGAYDRESPIPELGQRSDPLGHGRSPFSVKMRSTSAQKSSSKVAASVKA